MKTMNFKTAAARTVAAGCLLGLTMAAQSALACTVDNWNGGNSSNLTPGGPDSGIARYAGLCSMETPTGASSWVQDNSPGGISRIRARFYVLNELDAGQSAVIYRGFSDVGGASNLFTVRLATDGTVRLIDNATAVEVQQTSSTQWVSVEIDWSQGSGNGAISLSVNGQSPAINASLNNAGSSLQSVRLGNLLGAAGSLNFDAYESRRTTAIGRLCEGDAFLDGVRDFADINAIFVEFATGGSNPAEGTPDITEDGLVDFADINEVFVLFATGQGACPDA